jgi:integrase
VSTYGDAYAVPAWKAPLYGQTVTMYVSPRSRSIGGTAYKADADLVFGHPHLGTPLDATKLSRYYIRPALARAGVVKPFRPWHDLRHTALTHEAAAGNPAVYVQMKAGHSQGSITERYIHAAQVLFPAATERGEGRFFSGLDAPGWFSSQ